MLIKKPKIHIYDLSYERKLKRFVLDAGCSVNPKGDINVDIVIPYDYLITPFKYKDFVRADARFLPFRSKSFTHVKAYNLLEHIKDCPKALRELYRVGEHVEIRTDSIFSLANWFYFRHEQITIGRHFVPRPWMIRILTKLIYQIVDPHYDRRSRIYQWLRRVLVQAGILDRWHTHKIS